jgi:hypothetical protein
LFQWVSRGSKSKGGQGGKITLEERSPEMQDQTEKVGRPKVSKENSHENETGETISNERQEEVQDDQEMSEVSEGEETITNLRELLSGERINRNEEPVRNERTERHVDMHKDRRVDEFMLGEIFHRIENKFSKDMTDLVKKLPEGVMTYGTGAGQHVHHAGKPKGYDDRNQ